MLAWVRRAETKSKRQKSKKTTNFTTCCWPRGVLSLPRKSPTVWILGILLQIPVMRWLEWHKFDGWTYKKNEGILKGLYSVQIFIFSHCGPFRVVSPWKRSRITLFSPFWNRSDGKHEKLLCYSSSVSVREGVRFAVLAVAPLKVVMHCTHPVHWWFSFVPPQHVHCRHDICIRAG